MIIKKLMLAVLVLVLTGIFVLLSGGQTRDADNSQSFIKSSTVPFSGGTKTSLFVPYWSLYNSIGYGDYDQFLYFGVTTDSSGINKSETGYLRLADFTQEVGKTKEKLLVLRMLDSKTNFAILKDQKIQDLVIDDTLATVDELDLSGVVLNLELSALPFESLINQINNFNEKFYKTLKKENLKYQITVYGDVYYRVRPFDVKTLAKFSDKLMVMAYDLHKASGNPGPNFPLSGREKYGYDYKDLIQKLLSEVESEKIEVIFGLYGYDWQVDDKNIAQSAGKPLSYLEIKNSILGNCINLSCIVNRDRLSAETQIVYTAKNGEKHIVWFEDMESVSRKQEYLKSAGITNYSFWAHSYF